MIGLYGDHAFLVDPTKSKPNIPITRGKTKQVQIRTSLDVICKPSEKIKKSKIIYVYFDIESYVYPPYTAYALGYTSTNEYGFQYFLGHPACH